MTAAPPKHDIAPLLEALDSPERLTRAVASETLIAEAHSDPEVLEALITALRHPSKMVRRWVVESLGKAGLPAPRVVSALLSARYDQSGYVRYRVIEALGHPALHQNDVTRALISALQDPETGAMAARGLAAQHTATPAVLAALVTALQHDSSPIRESAARALGSLGIATLEVLEGLFVLASSHLSRWVVPQEARQALVALGPPAADFLHSHLDSPVPGSSLTAALVLTEMGSREPKVLAALLPTLRTENPEARALVTRALSRWVETVSEVRWGLLPLLNDPDHRVRLQVASALIRLPECEVQAAQCALGIITDESLLAFDRMNAVPLLTKLAALSPLDQRALIPLLATVPSPSHHDSLWLHQRDMLRSRILYLLSLQPQLDAPVLETIQQLCGEDSIVADDAHKLLETQSTFR